MGVGNNRETRYTVTGATEAIVDLNLAVKVDQQAIVTGMKPDAADEITVALAPRPNNHNGNHLTYIGVLQLKWAPAPVAAPATLSETQHAAGVFRFKLTGTPGSHLRGTELLQLRGLDRRPHGHFDERVGGHRDHPGSTSAVLPCPQPMSR